jgi:hypothetical protein
MVRLLLVVTLLALGAAGWISFDKVKTRIDDLKTTLDTTKIQRDDALTAQESAEKERNAFEKEADAAKLTASRLGDQIGGLQIQLANQTKRADEHEANLRQMTSELVESRQTSERWRQFEMEYGTRDSIKNRLATLNSVTNERDNFILENSILLGRIEKLSVELSRYTGTSVKVALPPNLAGKVTAVDSQYDFVVLNVGESQGVREHGELLVGRGAGAEAQLVGRLRILSVEKDRSIANIMPDYKNGDIQTGDSVFSERY